MIPFKIKIQYQKNIAKPAGLGLYCPGSRLTFALLFLVLFRFLRWWSGFVGGYINPARAIKNIWSGLCVGLVFIELATALGGQAALHGFVLP